MVKDPVRALNNDECSAPPAASVNVPVRALKNEECSPKLDTKPREPDSVLAKLFV